MERWPSGLRHTLGKREGVTAPWVQIPLFPPMKLLYIVLILVFFTGCETKQPTAPVIQGHTVVGFGIPKSDDLVWRGGDMVVPAGEHTNGSCWIVVPK
jgi:hypothetical protein